MYKFFLRGLDDVEVPDDIGEQIAAQYDQGTLPMTIKVNEGIAFESKAIKGYKRMANGISGEDAKADNVAKINQINAEYAIEMGNWAKRPIEERAKDLRFARMIWFSLTGTRDIDDTVVAEIEAEQLKYLQEHPEVIFANPSCLKSVLEPHYKPLPPAREGEFRPMGVGIRESGSRLAIECYAATLAFPAVVDN